MSLDLYLGTGPCETCGRAYETLVNETYTYNVSPMWYKIYPDDESMVYIDGMKGAKAYNKLAHAKKVLEQNKEEFESMNPLNGYGSYEGFVEFLDKLMKHTLANPKLTWSACR